MKHKLLLSFLLVGLLLSISGTAFAQEPPSPATSSDLATLTKSEAGLTAKMNGNKLQESLSSNLITTTSPIGNGNFEQGPWVGWYEYSTHNWPVVTASADLRVPPHGGDWAVWLGGDYLDTSYISQDNITIVSPTTLRLWYWVASEDDCDYDFGYVFVNASPIYTWDLCQSTNTGGWLPLDLSLDAYNGQTITLKIQVDADDALNSNLFIDDISLYQTFADVPVGFWSESFIHRLYNAGVTSGCSTSPLTYCPSTPVTRDQMAVFLLRGVHTSSYTPPAATGVFQDVPMNFWAASWIEQLATEGITSGCSVTPKMYCPTSTVTRDQMAVFLLKAKYGSSYVPPAATGVFSDVPQSYWAAAWIEKLAADGITGGCGNGNYCPTAPVTRDQMAVFLVKTFNLP